jgi:hypothetical protein
MSTIIAVTNTSKKDESGGAGIHCGSLGWRYSNHGGHYDSLSVHRSSFLYPYTNTRSTANVKRNVNVTIILYKWLACDLTLMIKTRCTSRRLLTPLGRKQAELTGQRLGKLIRGVSEQLGPCRVKVIRVSNLTP